MKIIEVISKFLNKIKIELSMGTYEHYKSHFDHFLKWCSDNDCFDTSDLSEVVLNAYLFELKETCSNRTINMRIGNLQRCFKKMDIHSEYLLSIPKLKQRFVTYDFIDLPDIKKMRKYFYSVPKNDVNVYHAAIFLILMETGCRRSELIKIEKKNIDFDEYLIKFTSTKTSEDRIVPFKEKTAAILLQLCQMNKDRYLFISPTRNRQLTKVELENIMRKYKKIFNFKKFHAHMFRHSFATLMIEAGVDRKTVQSMTGHKDSKSMDRYVHVRQSYVKQTYKDKYILD